MPAGAVVAAEGGFDGCAGKCSVPPACCCSPGICCSVLPLWVLVIHLGVKEVAVKEDSKHIGVGPQ